METTFITIHNLSPEANILYASESIVDILGYLPFEVTGRSCFDFFHPQEVPFARGIHDRGVRLDKAAVLHYAQVLNRVGQWVGCECVFTVVHDVLVACTSIYKGDERNERRALAAPAIRRLFASSPKDPRYHMLEHLSSKFRADPQPSLHEPRAALILNRFTRTLTVMYATNAVSEILGVSPDLLKDKSFYECIQENCLPDAIRCLESAKANDSIAYLRFWYRDPRRPEDLKDDEMREASQSSDSDEDGGVVLGDNVDPLYEFRPHDNLDAPPSDSIPRPHLKSKSSSEDSAERERQDSRAMFDHVQGSQSSFSSMQISSGNREIALACSAPAPEPYEIEAVVSCTSDGLVVVLRRARPMIPTLQPALRLVNGLFAAPWGATPIRPHIPEYTLQPMAQDGGPSMNEFMSSIRDVAVFAWSLAGINGNMASYSHGIPRGEAQPPAGLPIWDPRASQVLDYFGPHNQAVERLARMNRTNEPDGGYNVPFTHPRQEANLRAQTGYAEASRPGRHVHNLDYILEGSSSYQNHNAVGDPYGQMQPPENFSTTERQNDQTHAGHGNINGEDNFNPWNQG